MSNISREDVNIYIVDADTDPSTLDTSSETPIKGEISNYSESGGERQRTYDPVFGGYSKRDEPRSEYEVEFDLIIDASQAVRWEGYDMGEHPTETGVYVPTEDPTDKCIVIEATDSNSNSVTYAYNNAFGTMFDFDHSSDSTREGTMTFTIPPETLDGAPNKQATAGDHTALSDWSAL